MLDLSIANKMLIFKRGASFQVHCEQQQRRSWMSHIDIESLFLPQNSSSNHFEPKENGKESRINAFDFI